MADLEERRISDLTRALEVDSSALFEASFPDESSESGYSSMATDVETMAQKMLGGINFETQLQTTAKNIFGAINEVNKGSTPYDDTEIRQEISDIEEKIKGLSGLTDEQKQAILKDAEKQVWTDDKGEEYYVALYNALYPETPAETYITADDITPSSGAVVVNDEGTVTSENYTYAIKNFLNLELNIKTQSTYTSKWIETHPNAIVINQDGNNFVDLATAQSSSSYTVVGTVKDIQCYDKISAKLDNNTLTITYADGDTVSVTPANCIGIKETSWLHPYTYNVKKINLVIPDAVDINDYVTKETIDGVVAIEENEEGDEIDVVEPSDLNTPITFTVDSKFTLTGFKGVISGKIASVQITVTAKERVTASWSGIGYVSTPPKVAVVGSMLNLSNVARTPYMRINENGQTQFLFYSGIAIEVGDQLMFSCTYAID